MEMEQYNQLMTQPVTLSEEEELPDISLDDQDLQPPITQRT